VWTITSGFPALSAHVLVVPGRDCHGVQGRLQELLRESFGIDHATLQIDHAAEPLLTIGGDARASRDNHNAKGPEHTGGCADSSSASSGPGSEHVG